MGKYLWPEERVLRYQTILAPLEDGKELSEVMEEFVQRKDIRSHEGAIGILQMIMSTARNYLYTLLSC